MMTTTAGRDLTSEATDMDEPSLRELLDDPLVRRMMARDGVTRADVETLFANLDLRPDRSGTRPKVRLRVAGPLTVGQGIAGRPG